MKKLSHQPSLLTLNGKCWASSKLLRLDANKRNQLPSNAKNINNFVVFNMPWGADLMAYNQGCFKLTIKNTKHFKKVVQYLEILVDIAFGLLNTVYNHRITRASCKITQLVSILKWDFDVSDFKINYTKLIKLHTGKDCLDWCFGELSISHQINWVAYENGASSIFFNVKDQNERVCNFKLYMNLKIILFTYKLEKLPFLSEIIPHFIKEHIIKPQIMK